MVETVQSCGYGKKLGKYGFKPNLCTCKVECEEWLDFCKKNNMKWLDESYGTLVHKNFDNYFTRLNGSNDEITSAEIQLKIMDDRYSRFISLNHSNVLKSKINGVYMVTSSPNYIDFENIKKYYYSTYLIHPNLLEDYGLDKINLAFTNASFEEIKDINDKIYEDIGIYEAFRKLYSNHR